MDELNRFTMLVHNAALAALILLFLVACHKNWTVRHLRTYVSLVSAGAIGGLLIFSLTDPPRLLGLSMAVVGYALAVLGFYRVGRGLP